MKLHKSLNKNSVLKIFHGIKFIVLFFLFDYDIQGQTIGYRHFDTDDGLPSSEVYRVFPDNNGHLWFCTDKGVARYDSYKFIKYELPPSDKVILDGYCAEDGTIWFRSLKRNFFYFKDGKIFPLINSEITKHMNKYQNLINFYFNNGKFFLFTGNAQSINIIWEYNGKIFCIDSSDYRIKLHDLKSIQINVYSHKNNINQYTVKTSSLSDSFKIVRKNNNQINLTIPINVNEYILHEYLRGKRMGSNKKLEEYTYDNFILNVFYCNQNYIIFQLNQNLFISEIKSNKLYLLDTNFLSINKVFHSNGEFYFCKSDKGILKLNLFNKKLIQIADFESVSISDQFITKENSNWFSSINKGVYFSQITPGMKIINYLNTSAILKLNNRLFIATKENLLGEIVNNKFIEIIRSKYVINKIVKYKNNLLVHNKLVNINQKYSDIITSIFSDTKVINDSLLSINSRGIVYSDYNNHKLIYYLNSKIRLFCMEQLNNQLFLIGMENGLQVFNIHIKKFSPLITNNIRINKIRKLTDDIFFLGTYADGVYVYQYSTNKIISKFNTSHKLSSNIIYDLIVQDKNTIWTANDNGLNRIIFDDKFTVKSVIQFDQQSGLPSAEINCLELDSGILYIGTSKGLTTLDTRNIVLPNYKPKVYISGVDIIGAKNPRIYVNEFNWDENNVVIDFSAFVLNKPINDKMYAYAMIKSGAKDTPWILTNETRLQFTNLPPGNLVFVVKAQSRFGGFGPVASYALYVHPHFTQTWWFLLLCILIIAAIIYTFFRIRSRRLAKEAARESKFNKKVAELELQALRGQMNPHFIFNAMNSLQNLIVKNDVENASIYLGKIAKMFRDALEFSRNTMITMKVELEFIKRYLEIEQLRFKNKFTIEFDIEKDLEFEIESIEIQPLLMQPIAENAVKHGMKSRENGGKIAVRVYTEKDYLIYELEDNGGGLKEKRETGHVSRGMEITKQRIDLLNEKENLETGFVLEIINMPNVGVTARIKVPM